MKTNLDKELLDLISKKEFNELNALEKQIVTNNLTEIEYNYFRKIFSEENTSITPNISVKQNLDAVFRNKYKQKKYTLQYTILGIAAVITVGLFIVNLQKETQQLDTDIHTATLLSLGRIDDIYTKNNKINSADSINYYMLLDN